MIFISTTGKYDLHITDKAAPRFPKKVLPMKRLCVYTRGDQKSIQILFFLKFKT